MDAKEQLTYFQQYDTAKANLATHCDFIATLDITLNLTLKWHYEATERILYYTDVDPTQEIKRIDVIPDDFEFAEDAYIKKENGLFTVFLIDECLGSEYYLLVLNENRVEV